MFKHSTKTENYNNIRKGNDENVANNRGLDIFVHRKYILKFNIYLNWLEYLCINNTSFRHCL